MVQFTPDSHGWQIKQVCLSCFYPDGRAELCSSCGSTKFNKMAVRRSLYFKPGGLWCTTISGKERIEIADVNEDGVVFSSIKIIREESFGHDG